MHHSRPKARKAKKGRERKDKEKGEEKGKKETKRKMGLCEDLSARKKEKMSL